MNDMQIGNGGAQEEPSEPLKADSLSASLTVNQLDSSLDWYRMIGFAVEREYERDGKVMAVALIAGAVRVLLTQDDGARGSERAKGEGISLMLTTAQDVDGIAARIVAMGGALESSPADTPWGARVFRVRDPDGFRLAISSDPTRRFNSDASGT